MKTFMKQNLLMGYFCEHHAGLLPLCFLLLLLLHCSSSFVIILVTLGSIINNAGSQPHASVACLITQRKTMLVDIGSPLKHHAQALSYYRVLSTVPFYCEYSINIRWKNGTSVAMGSAFYTEEIRVGISFSSHIFDICLSVM